MRHSQAELLELCERHQVPCGPVYAIDEIFDDPQYAARGNIAWVADDRLERPLPIPAPMPRLSETPGRIESLGPPLGAHSDAIYAELGVSAEELARLRQIGVI